MVFANEAAIISAVENILAEKGNKRDCGKPGKAMDEYDSCISALVAIGSTNEIKSPLVESLVESAIKQFYSHLNLYIVVNGRLCSIYPPIAARLNVVDGDFVSSKRFLVLSKETAEFELENQSTEEKNAIWDMRTESLVHESFYYRRYPEEIILLAPARARELGLQDIYNQQLAFLG